MILKEFALISNQEKSKRFRFELQTRCVTSLFERCFPKFKTESTWKVLIHCVDNLPNSPTSTASGVINVFLKTDPDYFFTLANQEKKEWAFEHLEKGISKVVAFTNWPLEPFTATLNEIKGMGLENTWVWKRTNSPSRKLVAEVVVEHGVEECVISIVVRDRLQNIIKRQVIARELPDEWFFKKHLGKLRWISDKSLVVSDATGISNHQIEGFQINQDE